MLYFLPFYTNTNPVTCFCGIANTAVNTNTQALFGNLKFLPNGPKTEVVHRIIGGTETLPNKYPWQVSLVYWYGNTFGPFCGGTIMSNRHIMTGMSMLQ